LLAKSFYTVSGKIIRQDAPELVIDSLHGAYKCAVFGFREIQVPFAKVETVRQQNSACAGVDKVRAEFHSRKYKLGGGVINRLDNYFHYVSTLVGL